jgi:hypothetical protein
MLINVSHHYTGVSGELTRCPSGPPLFGRAAVLRRCVDLFYGTVGWFHRREEKIARVGTSADRVVNDGPMPRRVGALISSANSPACFGTGLPDPPTFRRSRSAPLAAIAVVAVASILAWVSTPLHEGLRRRAAAAYARGLDFLAASQGKDGEFPTYYWSMDDPTKMHAVTTVFTASQILYALGWGDLGETGHRVTDRAIRYLLAQKEPPGIWRYYGKDGAHLLSPDVDDTSVAWAALMLRGHAVAPEVLALLQASRNGAGLFNTWIGDPATWVGIDSRDIDPVVNLNALLLFSLAGRTVDEVCREAVADAGAGTFQRRSVYYPSPLAFTYALSRAYADGGASCLASAIPRVQMTALTAQRADGGFGNDLETALGVLTLLNSGYRGEAIERGIDAMVARQAPDGGWAIAPAYRAAVLPVSYGSRSLTTAVCLEALGKYSGR